MADVVNFLTPALGPLIIEEISTGGDNEIDVLEIFSEWKDWLLADSAARLGIPQAFSVIGGEPKSATTDLGQAFFLHPMWKIRPAEHDHRLVLVGDLGVLGGAGRLTVPTLGGYTVEVSLTTSALITGLNLANPPSVIEIVDGVLDEPLTGASHNDPTSVGRRIRQSQLSSVVHEGVAQSATASTFVMDTGAEAIDGFYRHNYIVVTGGLGVGQSRTIQNYTGASRTADVVPDWTVTPDGTSEFIIFPMPEVHAYEVHTPVDVSVAGVNAVRDAVLGATALDYDAIGTVGQLFNWLRRVAFNDVAQAAGNPGTLVMMNDAGDTPIATLQFLDENGDAILPTIGVPMRRTGIAWPPT